MLNLMLHWLADKLFMKKVYYKWFYTWYLRSPYWREIRKVVIEQAGGKCERCRRKAKSLQVHHLTYKRLGFEKLSDLQALCTECHAKADEERREDVRANRRKR